MMPDRRSLFVLLLLVLASASTAACMAGGQAKRAGGVMAPESMAFAGDDGGGGGSPSATGVSTGGSAGTATGAALPDEKLVVTGSMSLTVDNGPEAVATIRKDVEGAGGRVVHEQENGHDRSWYASVRVRLPPGEVTGFVERLAKVGKIESRLIETTDVSREYFDQEIALENLHVTLDRLQALLSNPALQTANVLEIERELTRVRGDIERIEGEHRFLQDRIAYATFDLTLSSQSVAEVLSAKARIHPGARMSMLYLFDTAAGSDRIRLGAGATLMITRASSFELDIYPDTDDTGRALTVTTGGATYSDFFGAGLRRWLNPYIGARVGYAYVAKQSSFLIGAELGLELFKSEHLVVDVATRAHGLLNGEGADPALQFQGGLTVPF